MTDGGADDERLARANETERRRLREEVRARIFGKAAPSVEIDRFALRRKLGEGATCIVYAAFDPRMHREVALKVLVAGPRDEASLFAEARAVSQLRHPNLVPVFEVGMHDGMPYIVSELVEGGTLRDLVGSDTPPAQMLDIVREVGRGVSEAHRRGLVHRDLKPENVLVGDGRPRVADFGVAQAWSLGDVQEEGRRLPGTPAYMAPEHLRGERADPLSDQFSYCVLAFEALYGRHPFGGSPAHEGVSRIAAPREHPLAYLEPVLARGLSREASARFGAMSELLLAIDAAVHARGSRRRLALGVGLVLVLGAVGAFFALRTQAPITIASREAPRARTAAEIDRALWLRVLPDLTAQRYDACAATLEREAASDAMRQIWLSCAQQAEEPEKVERACAAWRGASPSTVPTDCDEVVLRMRRLSREGRARECAEVGLGAPESIAVTLVLSRCIAETRDMALYRRQCIRMRRAQRSPHPEEDCATIEEREAATP